MLCGGDVCRVTILYFSSLLIDDCGMFFCYSVAKISSALVKNLNSKVLPEGSLTKKVPGRNDWKGFRLNGTSRAVPRHGL